jgi:hypothetical protein
MSGEGIAELKKRKPGRSLKQKGDWSLMLGNYNDAVTL